MDRRRAGLAGLAPLVLIAAIVPQLAAQAPSVSLPLERTAYIVGERIPLAVTGADGAAVKLEAVGADGRALLYQGAPGAIILDTSRLAPGDYSLQVDGATECERLTLTSPLRTSAAALIDEATPGDPDYKGEKDPAKRAAIDRAHRERLAAIMRESGLTGCVAWAAESAGCMRRPLDLLTRTGAVLLINPDTRPTSFNPVGNHPAELQGMTQRMALTATANARFPTFGGFCFGWDTCGYAVDARKMLMTYWGWGNQETALRNYLERIDRAKMEEFTRRTGLKPVAEDEYLSYLLSIGRPEFAPFIDLPTRRWIEELARRLKPMSAAEQAAFERRLDAWSAYLMGLYRESYISYIDSLRAIQPTLRFTSSVQSDHAAVRFGQNFPSAYEPLDFRYQSTWNDQVGGPDYAYQWLHVAGLLAMQREGRPLWISNALAPIHGRAAWPGKFTRVAAHGLAYGGTGIGFACEAFSNVFRLDWPKMRDGVGGADLRAGKDFLDRFVCLAASGRPGPGVGILWSARQYGRQHITMGYGSAPYQAQVSLARLGYTPRFVTEDCLARGRTAGLKALLVVSQTVPLPETAQAGLARFIQDGGLIVCDGGTTVSMPGAKKLDLTFPTRLPGKTHNMDAPLMVGGDANQAELWHRRNGPPLLAALGATGRAPLAPEAGAGSKVSVFAIDGGEAAYLVAVNDSYIKSQADWLQVRERLVPTAPLPGGAQLYDATEEKPLGPAGPVECDLTVTTARVFAILPARIGPTALSATQKVQAGDELAVRILISKEDGGTLKAIVPLQLTVKRPDGRPYQSFWRSTDRDGTFSMAVPIPANVTAGAWSVEVRNQLTGQVAALPVTVTAAKPAPAAVPLTDRTIVRDAAAIEAALAEGAEIVVPIADSPRAEMLAKAAEELRAALATRGVKATVWRSPPAATYTLAYDLTPQQVLENAQVDLGKAIGTIKRTTVNSNDWFGGVQSGYRFPKPVVVLDLVGEKGDAPLAEGGMTKNGILWPAVDAAFPGPGRAIVQAVPWAFAPRATAIIIQAMDPEGLAAGVRALTKGKLPPDRITPSIAAARDRLWREYHIGGTPDSAPPGASTATLRGGSTIGLRGGSPEPPRDQPAGSTAATDCRVGPMDPRGSNAATARVGAEHPPYASPTSPRDQTADLTAAGLSTRSDPHPFRIDFPDQKPPAEPPPTEDKPAVAAEIPGDLDLKKLASLYRVGNDWVNGLTAGFLIPDSRFTEAWEARVTAAAAARQTITIEGTFRYNDRFPRSQAQWETVLDLYRKFVPTPARAAMSIAVEIDGKPAGELVPVAKEDRDVPTNTYPKWEKAPPKVVREEVVTRLAGEIPFPAGASTVRLVHRNMVDGLIKRIYIGQTPPPPPPAPPAKKGK